MIDARLEMVCTELDATELRYEVTERAVTMTFDEECRGELCEVLVTFEAEDDSDTIVVSAMAEARDCGPRMTAIVAAWNEHDDRPYVYLEDVGDDDAPLLVVGGPLDDEAFQRLGVLGVIDVLLDCIVELVDCSTPDDGAIELWSAAKAAVDNGDWPRASEIASALLERVDEQADPYSHALAVLATAEAAARSGIGRSVVSQARAALKVLESCGATLELAIGERTLGLVFDAIGDNRSALEASRRSRSYYLAIGDEREADVSAGNEAIALARIGDPVSALALFSELLPRASARSDKLEVARLASAAGAIAAEIGRVDEGRDALERARRIYESAGMTADVAECDLNLAGIEIHAGNADAAHARVTAARSVLAVAGSPKVAMADDLLGHIALIRQDWSEARQLFRRAAAESARLGNTADAARSLSNVGGVELRMGLPAEAIVALEEALERGGASMSTIEQAKLRFNIGLAHLNLFERDRHDAHTEVALDQMLRALRLIDPIRHRMGAIADRRSWLKTFASMYELLIICASLRGDVALVSEVILRARAQGLPDVTTGDLVASREALASFRSSAGLDGETSAAEPVDAVRIALGSFPVTDPPYPSVGGVCRLAPSGAEVTDVHDVVGSLGGRDGWLWSTWMVGDRLWWSVVRPDATIDAGFALLGDERDNSSLAAAIAASHALMGRLAIRCDAEVRSAERRSAARLGAGLLPPSLLAALRQADREHPLRLILAVSGALTRLPLPALAVDEHARVRLTEVAEIVVAPPLSMCRSIPPPPSDWRISGIVVDPLSDLPSIRRLPARLGPSAAHAMTARGRAQCNRSAVLRSLSERSDANLGDVAVYGGHGVPAADGEDATTGGLRICDDGVPSVLAAGDLLTQRSAQPFRCAKRVVLCACSTAQVDARSDGEWWGIPIALLWSGADTVLATRWDLVDSDETVEFTAELTQALCEGTDVATALRLLQCRRLSDWRSDDPDRTAGGNPHVWAAWMAVGQTGSTKTPSFSVSHGQVDGSDEVDRTREQEAS